jgi:DNA repair exonuclease SbcCD ATPase subunit
MKNRIRGHCAPMCAVWLLWLLAASALALGTTQGLVAPAKAQAQSQTPADAITPVEEFSRQLEQFKKTIPNLNKRIEESTSSVDRWTDVEAARKEIAELRALVGTALGAVSDNGVVSQLGAKALAHARDKLRMLQHDTRFKPEERQFLVEQWQRLESETVTATDELADARKQFSDLLRTLQSNEDFIDELVQIRQAKKALEVIHRLTGDIRDASDQLRKLIGAIKPPGA